MRYLPLILAVLPMAAQAICKDPPCNPERPPVPGCAPADRCGTACCRQELFFNPHCANPAKSLCCPEGEVEVGNTVHPARGGQVLPPAQHPVRWGVLRRLV